MSKKKVCGIDLGTGNSCVAVLENGKPKVIQNAEGQRTTPSVVLIDGTDRKVGASAKRQMIIKPKNTVSFIKRFMGADWNDPDVQKMIKMAGYEVVNEGNRPRIKIDGKTYSAEEISSYILNYMVKQASDYYGEEVKDAVITCPAWYNDTQRQSVKLAGELAGLNVLRVINEPTAAILSANLDVKDSKVIAVVDIGCGTTDISVCEVSNVDGQIMVEVLASYGDVFLGGQNYDDAVVNWIIEEFKKEKGVDLKKDSLAYSRIVEAAEKAKIELGSMTETEINLPYITVLDNVPQMLLYKLNKAKYESLTANLTEKVVECVRKAIEKSKKNLDQVDEILLVGGMTRDFTIQDALQKNFNKPLNKGVNPDEAVALGAARQANIINGGDDEILLLDVTPISLGIETMGSVMTKLIDANTTIPTSKKEIFSTAEDNQSAVTIVVLQGERPMARDNKEIARFNLDGIAPAPRGVPQIEVTFDIDANGILSVKAEDKGTGKEQHITIQNPNALSQEEIDRIKADAEKFKEEDAKKEEENKSLNESEGYAYSIEKSLKEENIAKLFSEDDKKNFIEWGNKVHDAVKERNVSEAKEYSEKIKNVFEPAIEKMYKDIQNAHGQANSSTNPFSNFDFSSGPSSETGKQDDTVNAPYEEVK